MWHLEASPGPLFAVLGFCTRLPHPTYSVLLSLTSGASPSGKKRAGLALTLNLNLALAVSCVGGTRGSPGLPLFGFLVNHPRVCRFYRD